MLIIGIDPGISGSICFFQDGKILDVIEMPTMTEGKKNKKQVNGSQIYNEICKITKDIEKQEIRVVIEQVSAMPSKPQLYHPHLGLALYTIYCKCFIVSFHSRGRKIRTEYFTFQV